MAVIGHYGLVVMSFMAVMVRATDLILHKMHQGQAAMVVMAVLI